MPRQNRVLPTGQIVADPAQGLFMGNRGCLHRHDGTLGKARWRGVAWITCLTKFKGRKRDLMAPGRYTELFFLDEAVALAAGHRPCAECRHAAWKAYGTAWAQAGLPGRGAKEIDLTLHAARVGPDGTQITHVAEAADLPDGTFIALPAPHLVMSGRALPFAPEGYGPPIALPHGPVTVLTPAPTVATLRAGFHPVLHPTATEQ